MRDSLRHLIEIASDVKVLLGVSSFIVYECEDYCCCEFHVTGMIEPRRLLDLVGDLSVRMYPSGDDLVIKVYDEEV